MRNEEGQRHKTALLGIQSAPRLQFSNGAQLTGNSVELMNARMIKSMNHDAQDLLLKVCFNLVLHSHHDHSYVFAENTLKLVFSLQVNIF